MLGNKKDSFYLVFSENYFQKGDILTNVMNCNLRVLENPYKKWWKKLFQFITLGVYMAPTQYRCKVRELTKDESEVIEHTFNGSITDEPTSL